MEYPSPFSTGAVDQNLDEDHENNEDLLGPRPGAGAAGLDFAVTRAALRRRMFGGDERVRIGRFELGRRIGGGGMGVVFVAHDPNLSREVAIKLLHPDAGDGEVERTRLLREAQALGRLSHPNVVHVYDAGTHEGAVFIAMELVAGRTLRAWLAETRPPWRDVLRVYLGAARGLAAAHEAGLVHRDFKPDNVIVDDALHARVLDFGLARADEDQPTMPAADSEALLDALQSRLTRTGAVMGTPAYMAPEQLSGDAVTPASDQFAFCVALWEALYGERPYSVQGLARFVTDDDEVPKPATTPSAVPPRIASVLRRGLVLDPRGRFPRMTELAIALEHAATSRWRSWLIGVPVVAAVIGASLYAVELWGEPPGGVVEPGGMVEPSTEIDPPPPRVVATEDAWPADVDAPVVHRVAPFEDIASIAERYGVTESALRTWNELQSGAPIGDEIVVREPTRRPLPWQRIEHIVKPDETDWAALAERYGVDEAGLRALNDHTALQPGATIEVWIDPKPYPRPSSPPLLDAPAIEAHGSESRGYPSRGTIGGGVQVPESALYVRRSPILQWGSAHAVATLQRAMFTFRQEVDYPGVVVLSDMSKRGGGDLRPHGSHQSGRDVDIWLPSLPGVFEPEHLHGRNGGGRPRRTRFEEIDWYATWGLVRALVGTGAVRDIFLDWRYQEFLYRAAVSAGAPETELRWIQWPRPATSLEGVVIHSEEHLSHVHVRFDCARWEAECSDEKYRLAGD